MAVADQKEFCLTIMDAKTFKVIDKLQFFQEITSIGWIEKEPGNSFILLGFINSWLYLL